MTNEFIQAHCINCEYCIFEDRCPTYCGEITEDGCVSQELSKLRTCRKGHEYINHVPIHKVGDRFDVSYSILRILSVEGEDYIIQREGGHGRFNEPYPPERINVEEFDLNYTEDKIPSG